MGESASLIGQTVSHGRILGMRFFGGLSSEDTAEVIGASRTTVKRERATARAWLQEMSRKEAGA